MIHSQDWVEDLDTDAWEIWLLYRESIRKPIPLDRYGQHMKKLANFGTAQRRVVERSVTKRWIGLFPEKSGENAAFDAAVWGDLS